MNIIKLRMQFAQLNGMDKIFVIDDDKNLLQVMKSLLHLRGFNVSIFRNWEIAYQLMKLFKPQLILLDVFLTGIDGLEVCQRLKASPFTKHIPIILCSGYPQIAERGIREYGAADFIAKPFELDDLINKMHSVLSKR
jgi:two-component system alkaline phosphatase synthesis response regulator PhoP